MANNDCCGSCDAWYRFKKDSKTAEDKADNGACRRYAPRAFVGVLPKKADGKNEYTNTVFPVTKEYQWCAEYLK